MVSRIAPSITVALLLCGQVWAQPRVIKPGSEIGIKNPDGSLDVRKVDEAYALIPRTWMDKANATNDTLLLTKEELKRCEEARRLAKEKDNGWVTGLKWFGVGAAVAGAFFAGKSL